MYVLRIHTVMEIEFDSRKNLLNRAKHGLDLALAKYLFDGSFKELPDFRADYGEERWVAYGCIEGRAVVCVYTLREDRRRIISLRKANSRERDVYY